MNQKANSFDEEKNSDHNGLQNPSIMNGGISSVNGITSPVEANNNLVAPRITSGSDKGHRASNNHYMK